EALRPVGGEGVRSVSAGTGRTPEIAGPVRGVCKKAPVGFPLGQHRSGSRLAERTRPYGGFGKRSSPVSAETAVLRHGLQIAVERPLKAAADPSRRKADQTVGSCRSYQGGGNPCQKRYQ